jgi:hypothetical protein
MSERYSLLIVLALSFAGELTAHPPHHPAPPSRPTQRIPMRISGPPRVAPDKQTEPIEVGSVPEIDITEQVTPMFTT